MEALLKTWYGTLAFILFDVVALLFIIALTYRWLFKRILDFLTAVFCIAVLSPVYLFIFIWAMIEKKENRLEKVFEYTELIGKKGKKGRR